MFFLFSLWAQSRHSELAYLTKLVDAAERKGFVIRQQNPSDRRSNTIILTDLALSLKDDAKNTGIFILDKKITDISEDELNAFLNTLAKLCDNMEEAEKEL